MASCLTDVKERLRKEKIPIIAFNGFKLETALGVFDMDSDNLYLDKTVIGDKELAKLIADYKESHPND